MTVLLADEIKRLCEGDSPMITPFEPGRLRPASYQLTLGDEANVGGQHRRVDSIDGIVLVPHQVAVVCTREVLTIPRNVIARWSLRVTNIYEGLLWTGGPQVDPGWKGRLFCPIYNLSEREVVLKYGDPMFTIDFVRTTCEKTAELEILKQEYPKVWFTPERSTLQQHDRHRLHSAPYEALRELTELSTFRNFAAALIAVLVAVIGSVIAALAIIATRPEASDDAQAFGGWVLGTFCLSAAAFVLSLAGVVFQICSSLSRLKRRR